MSNIFTDFSTTALESTQIVGSSLLSNDENSQVKVPEVTKAYEMAIQNPQLIWRTFYRYFSIIDSMANLSEADLAIIARANEIRAQSGETLGSASAHGVIDFINAITPEQRALIHDLVVIASDQDSPNFKQALADLTRMMHNGHTQKANVPDWVPTDGDPVADGLIWGHTQLTDPEVLIHFTMSHYFERYMSVAFSFMGVELANHKDWFLNAFTDVLALNYVKGEKHAVMVGNKWAEPRAEGGLGWLKPGRIAAYKQALEESLAK